MVYDLHDAGVSLLDAQKGIVLSDQWAEVPLRPLPIARDHSDQKAIHVASSGIIWVNGCTKQLGVVRQERVHKGGLGACHGRMQRDCVDTGPIVESVALLQIADHLRDYYDGRHSIDSWEIRRRRRG